MYDSEFLYAFDLDGKDVTVIIERAEAGLLVGSGGRKTKKPIVYFEGKTKGLALCKTNARTIAALYGNDTDKWKGQKITLFPTTTQFGPDTVECVRIRPQVPK
jgi:hypothetical protein